MWNFFSLLRNLGEWVYEDSLYCSLYLLCEFNFFIPPKIFLKATKSRARCPYSFIVMLQGREWTDGSEYGDKTFRNPNVEPAGFSILHWPLPGWERAWEVCVFCVCVCVCVCVRVHACMHACVCAEGGTQF